MELRMAMQNSEEITWEDVEAVAKVLGVCMVDGFEDNERTIYRRGSLGAIFTDPTAALEYLTAEEHFFEKKYANILRTKPQP
jgi:hypothetical protein